MLFEITRTFAEISRSISETSDFQFLSGLPQWARHVHILELCEAVKVKTVSLLTM